MPDHWRAMMRGHPEALTHLHPPRTFRDHVHDGQIARASDTGCAGGYSIRMVASDDPP